MILKIVVIGQSFHFKMYVYIKSLKLTADFLVRIQSHNTEFKIYSSIITCLNYRYELYVKDEWTDRP